MVRSNSGKRGDRARPDWPLRLGLFGVLALMLVLLTLAPWNPTRKTVTVGAGPASRDNEGSAPTTTSPPAGRPQPRVQVSPGCGLSFTPGAAVEPVGHCTVVEIGDSLGNDLGWALARHLTPASGLHLIQLDRSATGLANTRYYDWSSNLTSDVATYHPQLVLISLGGNDQQGIEVGGSAVQFPSPAWQAAYLTRVTALIRQATAGGAYVVWVGLPIMQQPSYSQGVAVLDHLYQEAATADPHAAYISTWTLFAGPQGGFATSALVDGRPASLRQPDGIHYSFAGEDVLATFVISELGRIGHVALAPVNPAIVTS